MSKIVERLVRSVGKRTFENCYNVAKEKGEFLTKKDLIIHDSRLVSVTSKSLESRLVGIKKIFRNGLEEEALLLARFRRDKND